MAFESSKKQAPEKGANKNKVAMQLGGKIRPRRIQWGFGAACRSMDGVDNRSASMERSRDQSQRGGPFQVKSAVAMLESQSLVFISKPQRSVKQLGREDVAGAGN